MPVIRSAKKKLRADARKQKINQKVEAAFKLAVKALKKSPSKEALGKAYSTLDVAAKKGVIPKKRADRKKSRLATLIAMKSNQSTEKAVSRRKNKTHSSHENSS